MIAKPDQYTLKRQPILIHDILAPLVPYLAMIAGVVIWHNVWLTIISYHFGMLIFLALSKPTISTTKLFKSKSKSILLVMALTGAAGGLLLYYLWPFLNMQTEVTLFLQKMGLTGASWPGFIIYFVLVNPFLEEYYWRHYLGSNSKKPIIKDFFFAGYHLIVLAGIVGYGWLIIISVILGGGAWLWRQIDRLNQSLLPSIISHFWADASIIAVVYIMAGRG